jgi:adenylate cyclase
MKTPGCDDDAPAAPLPAEQNRLSQLLSASPAVIYGYRASGDFAPTYVSENIKRLFGYETEEYLSDANFWRDRVHPDELAAVEAEAINLFRRGHHSTEYRFLKKDGTWCWVNDEQQLARDINGDPVEVVGSWSDVTE